MTKQELRNIALTTPLAERVVPVKKWGIDVLVREMTGEQRARFATLQANKDVKNAYTWVVIACALHPETREPLFEEADREVLLKQSGAALEEIGDVALQLSAMTKDDLEAAKNVSPASEGSTSSSPVA